MPEIDVGQIVVPFLKCALLIFLLSYLSLLIYWLTTRKFLATILKLFPSLSGNMSDGRKVQVTMYLDREARQEKPAKTQE